MDKLNVFFQNILVGELYSLDRNLYFQYSENWLADETRFALCPQLPLQTTTHHSDDVLYFFSNLLPEGPVLDALLKLKKLPKGDVFSQLKMFGEDAAGAFSITPETAKRNIGYQLYTPERLREDIQKLSQKIPLLASHAELRLSLAGAQNKITVKVVDDQLFLPLVGAPSTHILKPEIEPRIRIPNSVENEAFCITLAHHLGLDVVEVNILHNPEPLLLVKRFDRIVENENIRRLHQLDFCQLKGVLPDQKYQKDAGPSFQDIFNLINQYSAVPAKDRLSVIDWILFNYLIGNADAHGKNITMLQKNNQMKLAPFYDLMSTAVYEDLDTRMAMSIGGEYRPAWVLKEHWKQFSEALDLNFSLLSFRAKQLIHNLPHAIEATLRYLTLDPSFPIITKIQTIIEIRSKWLQTRLR